MTSALLVRDMLEAHDAGFLPALLALGATPDRNGRHDENEALSVLKPWLADTSAWARAQLLAYVADGCARPGHRRLVRGLLRAAEAGDDELLGHLCAAFDRLVPTRIVTRTRFDWSTRESVRRRTRTLAGHIPFRAKRHERRWTDGALKRTGRVIELPTHGRFSVVTRRYLQRRAVRALRALVDHPARYVRAASAMLLATPPARLAEAAGLLDARALLTVLYRHSDALRFAPHKVDVAAGHTLAAVRFAPLAEEAWAAHGVDALLDVVAHAPAALARRFAAAELQRASPALPLARLRPLLRASHEEARATALVLLSLADTSAVTPNEWLALLDVDDPALAGELASRAAAVLAHATLEGPALVALCRARAAPVAELAARLLIARLDTLGTAPALGALDAEVPRARALLLDALAPRLVAARDVLGVRDLLDSPHADVRARGATLLGEVETFADAPALWTALVESPHADLRAVLLAHLEARRDAVRADAAQTDAAQTDAVPAPAVLAACAAALLDALRGAHQRPRALALAADLLADAARTDDALARRALPLFGIALHAMRATDRRAALATVVRTVHAHPHTRPLFATLPGVTLPDDVEVHA